ncbi:MAG: monovalent cation/H+ antiporter complex subunit F [Clostridia bacterium]
MVIIAMMFLLLSAFTCFFKVIYASDTAIRIVAADTLGFLLVIILALLAVVMDAVYFFDITIVYSVLMFIDILVIANYFEKGMISK